MLLKTAQGGSDRRARSGPEHIVGGLEVCCGGGYVESGGALGADLSVESSPHDGSLMARRRLLLHQWQQHMYHLEQLR